MNENHYKLGILGGMGPWATSELYKRIIDHTDAKCDQDHIEMVILNNASTPDRTKALLEGGKSPLPYLNHGIQTLSHLGCEYFVIPCNTAHAYSDKFWKRTKMKFIDMIETVTDVLKEKYQDKKICVLCTNGTKDLKIYEDKGVDINYATNQDKVMDVITKTKAGLDETQKLQEVINEEEKEYDVFVLACTELSLYKDKLNSNSIIIDAMDELVKKIIKLCGKVYK